MSNAFGVAKDFRETKGEAAFQILVKNTFEESDTDKSGAIDKTELRGTLKKLGIRLSGQTAAILTHYDKDGSGQIDLEEFGQLVSDMIDGTFERELKPKLEEAMKAAQAELAVKQQQEAAAAAQQAAAQQAAAAAAAQNQSLALVEKITKLSGENGKLKDQVATLKKQVQRLQNKVEEQEDALGVKGKKDALDGELAAMEAKMMSKAEDFNAAPKAKAGAKAAKAAASSMGMDMPAGPMSSMDAAASILQNMDAKEAAAAAAAAAPAGKKKGMFGFGK